MSQNVATDKQVSGSRKALTVLVTILGTYFILAPFLAIIFAPILTVIFLDAPSQAVSNIFSSIPLQIQALLLHPMSAVITAAHVVIGVGLIARKELARIALIGLAALSIVMSVFSLISFTQTVSVQQPSDSQMTNGAAAQQQADQQQPTQKVKLSSRLTSFYVGSSTVSIAFDVAVIIFLTRASVRRQFN